MLVVGSGAASFVADVYRVEEGKNEQDGSRERVGKRNRIRWVMLVS